MNSLYRFSPILNEPTFWEALEYTTKELQQLSQKLLGEKLPVSILKLFPHYPEEEVFLFDFISKLGPKTAFSSESSMYVSVDKEIAGNHINVIGVRFLDPYRMQVGCGDYEVAGFETFREKHRKAPYIRDVKDNRDMLEIWYPDSDVLGYIIQPL